MTTMGKSEGHLRAPSRLNIHGWLHEVLRSSTSKTVLTFHPTTSHRPVKKGLQRGLALHQSASRSRDSRALRAQ